MNNAQPEPPQSPSDAWRELPLRELLRAGGKPLLGLLVFALAFKFVVLLAALADDPLMRFPTSDIAYYIDQARLLIAGRTPAEPHHMPPLYAQLRAWLGDAPLPGAGGVAGAVGISAVLVAQLLAGVLGLALAWIAAARRVGPRAALLAPALCLAYGPLGFFELKGLGDSLGANLMLGLLVVVEALPRAKRPALVAGSAGVLSALAALLRPQVLLVIVLLAPWVWRRARLSGAAMFLGAAALVLAPSTLHNLDHSAGLVPVSDNGPFNLWVAHTGPMSGSFATDRPEFGNIAGQAHVSRALASAAAGRALSWAEVSSHWRGEALAAMFAAPLDTLQRVGLRAAAMVESFGTGIVAIPEVEMALVTPLRLAALPFGLLLGAFLGLWIAAGRPRPSAAAMPWLLVCAATVASTLMFFHYERFRLPLVPALAVGVCVLGTQWSRQRSARGTDAASSASATGWPTGRVVLGGFVLILVTAQSYLPRTHHANTLANGWASVAEARRATANGSDDFYEFSDALDDFDRALAIDPRSPRALLGALDLDLYQVRILGDSASAKSYAAAGERLLKAEQVLGAEWPELRRQRGRIHLYAPPASPWFDEQAALAIYEQFEAEAKLNGTVPQDGGDLGPELKRRGFR